MSLPLGEMYCIGVEDIDEALGTASGSFDWPIDERRMRQRNDINR
jgi:hypothetical protein